MSNKFWGLDGYPCTFAESHVGKRLMVAIQKLPGGSELTENEVEQKAEFILRMANFAMQDAENCNRPTSQKKSDDELRKLHDLCEKLASHIEKMHAPAITALSGEGFLALPFSEKVREMQEGARVAFGSVEGMDVRGRKPEIEASQLSDIAGGVYKHITGKRPTFTTDPSTGKVSGAWPDFLKRLFDVLDIRASVAAQARAVSEKMRSENAL